MVSERNGYSIFAQMPVEAFVNHLHAHGLIPTSQELQPISSPQELLADEEFNLMPTGQKDGWPVGETVGK
jgi:hypothetical protein